MTAAGPIAAVGRFLAQTWGCRYFWYAAAFCPCIWTLFFILETLSFLNDSSDHPLGMEKLGWAFAAERNYVMNAVFWNAYFTLIILGVYVFKAGWPHFLARVLLLGFWVYAISNLGRDI